MEIYKVDAGQACPWHEWKKLKPYKTKNLFLQQKISNFHTMGQKQYFSDDIYAILYQMKSRIQKISEILNQRLNFRGVEVNNVTYIEKYLSNLSNCKSKIEF